MSSLVEVLGVEAGAETESDTSAELNVVCESGNTAVVDLGLEGGDSVSFLGVSSFKGG